jgi:hypothetical protein
VAVGVAEAEAVAAGVAGEVGVPTTSTS